MSPQRKLFAPLSWLVGAAAVVLFPWGGFVLLPVALDLWESGREEPS